MSLYFTAFLGKKWLLFLLALMGTKQIVNDKANKVMPILTLCGSGKEILSLEFNVNDYWFRICCTDTLLMFDEHNIYKMCYDTRKTQHTSNIVPCSSNTYFGISLRHSRKTIKCFILCGRMEEEHQCIANHFIL